MKARQFLARFSTFMVFILAFGWAGQILLAESSDSQQENAVSTIDLSSLSQPSTVNDSSSALSQNSSQENISPVSVDNSVDSQASKRADFLNKIKNELQSAQQNYSSLNSQSHDTEGKLNDIQEQTLSLNDQLQNLDQQISDTSALVENVLVQITEKENTLKQLNDELQTKTLEIENQKQMLMEYLNVLYEQQNSIADGAHDNDTVNIMKLLFSDKPIGETLQELKYFKILETDGHEIFTKLETLAGDKERDEAQIISTKGKLTDLYTQLSIQKQSLEDQRAAKNQLLAQTQGQEKIYQQLLDESKREEAQALEDITSLRDNLEFIKQKISELGDKFDPEQYKDILTKETTDVYDYIKSTEGTDGFQPSWPVSPSRGISAYFHDASYRKAMGMEHQAIDIPTPQSTPIHAPADGVVYKTRDNGYGYSYIILAHAGGFMTLYGHVSEIRVIEGQKIKQGEVIGLSGATPGTKGAGLMTTGPHLHFEVMKGGTHVDPLDYLPLSYLPLKTLPEKYLARAMGEQAKVKRVDDNNSTFNSSQELLNMADSAGKAETGNSN